MKNLFGIESHPTDTFIHWSLNEKDSLALAKELRGAYDKIVAAGLKEDLDILTEAAYNNGTDDEADNNAGESL